MRRRWLVLAGVGLAALAASGHVGSPDTVFEGTAGPYLVRVVIRAPRVVPGLADISVRVIGGPPVEAVTVLPLRGGTPTAALPPADTAQPVAGNPGLHTAQLWLMNGGAYSVQVNVSGPQGSGVAIVPVMAVATRRLGFDRALALALSAAGLFLIVGALTVVRAAVRESTLVPGAQPDPRRGAVAWGVTAGAAALLALALWGGKAWWDGDDRAFLSNIYRPMHVTTSVPTPGTLRIAIDDSAWLARQWTPLIPDHGKLMHLFLVRDDVGAFAHLHPVGRDSTTFDAALPPVPAGRYRVYADIVHESGFTQTLVDTVEIVGQVAAWRASDPDDSWSVRTGSREPGAEMTLERSLEPIVAGRDVQLTFSARAPDGRAARLEPYMGLPGHAAVTNADGSVFIHLHSLGTVSMASQLVYTLRQPGDTVRGQLGRRITGFRDTTTHAVHASDGVVTFPYAFPKAGRYTLWAQVKRQGRVLTGAFDIDVQ
jgi:hypothetical protein